MTENHVCYAHYSDDGRVFYVGVGNETRPYNYIARSQFWKKYVKKHCAYGKPTVKIWYSDLSWEKACEKERMWIALYGRRDLGTGCLVNLTDGGEGAIGHVHSEETKAKMAEAQRGRKHSEESKNKMSEAGKGKKRSEETKRKMAEAHRGNKPSEEARAKMSKAKRGNKLSEETKRKMSEAKRGKKRSEEAITKTAEANRGKIKGPHSEEAKRKMSEAKQGKGKGYCFNKQSQKYQAYISINGKLKHLGCFLTEAEARAVYLVALEKYNNNNRSLLCLQS